MNNIRQEFRRIQTNGFLGNPDGDDSYAYLRASSERQVEEGSSFPRQLESVHKAAAEADLRIPFKLVFFDDGYSGFEFEHRPALIRLRHEVYSASQASHLVIEDIDRLSRNADWQQGYLLEEFAKREIQVHFWTHPGSQLERYVRGYIAQEGMKKDIERMRMGGVYKAMDGKVTAKRPRYGYVITDPTESFYELHPQESSVIRAVYEKLAYDGWTLNKVATWLNDRGVPTRFKTGFWTASTLYQMVKSPVYKGDYYANRYYQVPTGEFNSKGRPKKKNKLRPESEWIHVEVPAIVTPDEWDRAHLQLSKNATRSSRNSKKRNWLLSGFVRCAHCADFTFVAIVGGSKRSPHRYYGCYSRNSMKAKGLGTACYTPYVLADELETRVWETIQSIIYSPDLLLERLKARSLGRRNEQYKDEMTIIDGQLRELENHETKYESAYLRDVYTIDEFETKMRSLQSDKRRLEIALKDLQMRMVQAESVELQTRIVNAGLEKIRNEVEAARAKNRMSQEIPFELKRRILTLLVDVIKVDSEGRVFTIEGAIRGTYDIDDEISGVLFSSGTTIPSHDFAFESSRK